MASQTSDCPCGRSHPPTGTGRKVPRRSPALYDGLTALEREALAENLRQGRDREMYEAHVTGRLDGFTVDYARDCKDAKEVPGHSDRGLPIRRRVRCRQCPPCLRARTNYWGYAAMRVTLETQEAGLRTWFGTLTLNPASQAEFDQRAFEALGQPSPPSWWEDPKCDAKFALLRDQLVLEVQKYWKRLRKQGHRFKYFLVFERHKSGLPHMHFLLHEEDKPIRARTLTEGWPWGFAQAKLVGGQSASAPAPEKAAWYVVKYLSKSYRSRQLASRRYCPLKRDVQPMGRETSSRANHKAPRTGRDEAKPKAQAIDPNPEVLERRNDAARYEGMDCPSTEGGD